MFLKRNEKGRSMIEILGVLGIMAVITVLSISAYSMAMKNIKVNNVKSEIATIVQYIKSIQTDGDFSKWTYSVKSGCGSGGTKCFRSVFVDTGLMKEENGFGAKATSTFTGYIISPASDSEKTTYLGANFFINVVSDEEKELNLLKSQNFGDGFAGSNDPYVYKDQYYIKIYFK